MKEPVQKEPKRSRILSGNNKTDVIRRAQERAQSGDTVLLAPACASMDQFLSYSDRGDRFTAAVEKVVRDGK